MGVTFENGKYRARVSIGGGKRRSLGRYDTKLKAQRAISRYHKEQDSEKAQEAELQTHLDNLSYENENSVHSFLGVDFGVDDQAPLSIKKPSVWDRIKSIWQNIRQQS